MKWEGEIYFLLFRNFMENGRSLVILHYDLAFDDESAQTSGLLVHVGEYVQQDLIDSTKRDIQTNFPQPKIGAVLWKYFKKKMHLS